MALEAQASCIGAFEADVDENKNRNWTCASLSFAAHVRRSFRLARNRPRTLGGADAEIRIGNIMPYTGPLAAFAAIGRAEAAYFDMVNDRGGINGRKIRFISGDDSSNPRMAVEQTINWSSRRTCS